MPTKPGIVASPPQYMILSRFTSLLADNEKVSKFWALQPGEPRQPFSRRFMFSRKDEPSSNVTPGILCDLRILELLRKVRSTGGSQPLSGSSSIDFPLSIMCTAFRERRMSLSCTRLPRWSTWYCNPSSCARQAVSFWMEASAYFWSAACKALGSGVGIVSWGSVGGVLHAARSRCSKASEIWCLAVFLARRALLRVVAGVLPRTRWLVS